MAGRKAWVTAPGTINTTLHRLLMTGTVLLAITAFAGQPAQARRPAPESIYEIHGRPDLVRPGQVITFTGTCWDQYLGATTHVDVRGARTSSGGATQPFGFALYDIDANPSTGSYSGRITVPHGTPEGDYTLRGQCFTQDQVLGIGEDRFAVRGDPMPTTTAPPTTTTTSPTTTSHGPGQRPTPPPATPLPGTVTFTG